MLANGAMRWKLKSIVQGVGAGVWSCDVNCNAAHVLTMFAPRIVTLTEPGDQGDVAVRSITKLSSLMHG